MSNLALYDTSGFILSTMPLVSDEMLEFDYGPGINMLVTEVDVHPDHFWVNAGQVQALLPFPAVDITVTPVTAGFLIEIQQIPVGTQVIWPDDVATIETDGVLDCEVNTPGDYAFRLQHVMYYDKVVVTNVQ